MLIYLQMIENEPDKIKFERLYLKYKYLMHHVANKILHNQEDAEDAVHEAFISIAKNISKVSQVDCPKTRSYIVIIVERKAIDILRGREKYPSSEYNDAMAGIEIRMDEDDALSCAMAKLPARYREILLLRYDNGYSTKELAKILNMSQETAQKALWRAKEALHKKMEEGGIEE